MGQIWVLVIIFEEMLTDIRRGIINLPIYIYHTQLEEENISGISVIYCSCYSNVWHIYRLAPTQWVSCTDKIEVQLHILFRPHFFTWCPQSVSVPSKCFLIIPFLPSCLLLLLLLLLRKIYHMCVSAMLTLIKYNVTYPALRDINW